ncbi:MAG TPA: ABC transporter ATP-binding protein, partial [Acidimicrobiales bacterium]|nr:ABC transporter ATP-binding protein [Acidimicrobiales bacterium]
MEAPELGRQAGVPALEISELRTDFHMRHSKVRAVDGVSLSVMPGECVGLVGESGCGKSTIGLSAMRLLPNNGHISGGSVLLGGRDLVSLSEREMQGVRGNEMGMIFQDPMTSLNPTMTIGRQIGEPLRVHKGLTQAQANERVVEVLRLVGMPSPEERVHQYPHQLSGGLRQRVMIAMALACDPKVLIADEPTTALDVTIQAQILDLIDELRERLSMAVLLITHDMGVIAARTSRVIVMYAGKVVEAAATDELFERMRHPYSEALFESIPRLDQDPNELLYSIPGLPPDLSKPVTACRFAPRCRYATTECVTVEPPLEGGEHKFACYHPVLGRPDRHYPDLQATGGAVAAVTQRAPRGPAPGGGAAMLELDHVEKQYEVTGGAVMKRPIGTIKAVSDVSLSVGEG